MAELIQEVYTDASAPPAEVTAVEDAFARAGFPVKVQPGIEYKSGAELIPWIVQVTLATPIAVFLSTLAAEAAKDAYAAVKAWVRDVWNARAASGRGGIRLTDPDGTNLILTNDVPEEALDAVSDIEWALKKGHYLVWDGERREWRDPTRREP